MCVCVKERERELHVCVSVCVCVCEWDYTVVSELCNTCEYTDSISLSLQSGPVFQSGGDEANPCEYSFTWETPGACPVKPAHSSTCSVQDPESGRLYDFSPLADLQNHFTVSSNGTYIQCTYVHTQYYGEVSV